MKTLKYFRLFVLGIIISTPCTIACTITYQWNKHFFAGATTLSATYNQATDKYDAQETYTLKGIWKKLKDGKVTQLEVTCLTISNVVLWDNFNRDGDSNGTTFSWHLPAGILTTSMHTLKKGTHTYKAPDGTTPHEGNQVNAAITFVPVPSP